MQRTRRCGYSNCAFFQWLRLDVPASDVIELSWSRSLCKGFERIRVITLSSFFSLRAFQPKQQL
jgi:hypothetical protein